MSDDRAMEGRDANDSDAWLHKDFFDNEAEINLAMITESPKTGADRAAIVRRVIGEGKA